MNLKPVEFWLLTPKDIDDLLEGYDEREKIYEQKDTIWDKRIGWVIQWFLTPFAHRFLGKKVPLIEKLIPKWEMKKDNKKTPFESRNELKELKKDFKNGKRRNN